MPAETNGARFVCRSTFQLWYFLSICAAICLLPGCGRDEGIDDTVTPVSTMFQYLVADPLSITASDIQGGGHTWQGYSIYLRFRPSKPLPEILLKKGYTQTTFKDVAYRFELEPRFNGKFSPAWRPSDIKNPRCFVGSAKNKWTTSGEDYFIVDEGSGVVYFYGNGV